MLGADDQLRMASEDHRQGVGAFQPAQRGTGRGDRGHAAFEVQVDQLGDRLGIGFRAEFLALGLQLRPQFGVVFDDAVVHQGDERRAVRVGVAFGGRAVGRPAGMADADAAGQGVPLQRVGEVAKLALGSAAVDVAVHQGGDAGAVIAAVFQAAQCVENDRGGGTGADYTDNATHSASFLLSRCPHLFRPPRLLHLPGAGQRQGVRFHILGDHAAGADERAVADGDRGHQGNVGANKSMRADRRAMFICAIIITCDRAGADIGIPAHRGVADVAEMAGLHAGCQMRRP